MRYPLLLQLNFSSSFGDLAIWSRLNYKHFKPFASQNPSYRNNNLVWVQNTKKDRVIFPAFRANPKKYRRTVGKGPQPAKNCLSNLKYIFTRIFTFFLTVFCYCNSRSWTKIWSGWPSVVFMFCCVLVFFFSLLLPLSVLSFFVDSQSLNEYRKKSTKSLER